VPNAHQPPINKDAQPVTQQLCLLHAVCGQHNGPVTLVAPHNLPQSAARCRVQALQHCIWQQNHIRSISWQPLRKKLVAAAVTVAGIASSLML
jgi:hypothetical protein